MHMITNVLLTLLLVVEVAKICLVADIDANVMLNKYELKEIRTHAKAIRAHVFQTALNTIKHGI